jgi:hypothetical protein
MGLAGQNEEAGLSCLLVVCLLSPRVEFAGATAFGAVASFLWVVLPRR